MARLYFIFGDIALRTHVRTKSRKIKIALTLNFDRLNCREATP
ncbi:hypothetical protein [Coleofasciculus chthonoplastes]|nr:hypothetical protein [Coleofasciculus chthonoplastes]